MIAEKWQKFFIEKYEFLHKWPDKRSAFSGERSYRWQKAFYGQAWKQCYHEAQFYKNNPLNVMYCYVIGYSDSNKNFYFVNQDGGMSRECSEKQRLPSSYSSPIVKQKGHRCFCDRKCYDRKTMPLMAYFIDLSDGINLKASKLWKNNQKWCVAFSSNQIHLITKNCRSTDFFVQYDHSYFSLWLTVHVRLPKDNGQNRSR